MSNLLLGGGFKDFFYVHPDFGEMMQFDQYFSDGLTSFPVTIKVQWKMTILELCSLIFQDSIFH